MRVLDLTGFTHLLRADRDFMINTLSNDKYSKRGAKTEGSTKLYRVSR